MYNINRLEASEILWVSTRSIDRYIKSWKIRAEKKWKIILLNDSDIKTLSWAAPVKQKIIVTERIKSDITELPVKTEQSNALVKKDEYEKVLATFEKMFSGFREEIKDKDSKIQELAIKLWRAEEQKSNSVDMMEYKKVQFLSEETKKGLSNSLEKEKTEKEKTLKDLKYEKTTNKLLIAFIIILFIVAVTVFVIKI